MLKSLKCATQDGAVTNGYAGGYLILPPKLNFIAQRNRICRMFQVPDQNSRIKNKNKKRHTKKT